jgi:MoaA/NifB/PqqE/SkfB family radical SAM enzyme
VKTEIDNARERRCDHVVAVGWGEPTLYRYMEEMISYCKGVGMESSIITNGSSTVYKYDKLYKLGLNHLHVSVHGLGDTLDNIARLSGAGVKQEILKDYLRDSMLPWRSNTTIQNENFGFLPEIVEDIIDHGASHIVLLGFLPHYEWVRQGKGVNVIVPPSTLRPFIEEALDILIDSDRLFTLRYHPMCHLSPKYWKYVVNARYVLYDPWEWEYLHHGLPDDQFKKEAIKLGDSVANTSPCLGCVLYDHCGGWNKVYASLCDGAELKAIEIDEVPNEYLSTINSFGGFHMMNPANHTSGKFL